ncbi:unnamed protein product [Blepharisma stoltei]|uniref:PX domain-containing protein n=1 Tax=Blepharisma stoltei TaxID=1481888 RepID=A0AAU9JYZ3_9CILI|nr:unnamed protein product [Blepharisma stoltei]
MDPLANFDRAADHNGEHEYQVPVDIDIDIQCKILDQNFSIPIKDEVDISVSNPKLKEQKITKHITYSISGNDSQGRFESFRRYNDFLLLRARLVNRWPGCFIPQLPPKKRFTSMAHGNLQPQFIEQRRKLLNYFIRKLGQLSYVKHSPEFIVFTRGGNDFKAEVNEIKIPSTIEIANTFHNEFTEYLLYQESPDDDKKVEEAEIMFRNGIEAIENFEEICKRNVESYNGYDNGLLMLTQGLRDMNCLYRENYKAKYIDFKVKESHENPYQILLDWARTEVMDLRSILEAIEQKKSYDRLEDKFKEKLEEDNNQLENMQQGRKSLMQKLTKKPIEHYIAKRERIIKDMTEEINGLSKIKKIITSRLVHKEIPKFRESKIHQHDIVIKAFARCTVQEFENWIIQNKEIQKGLNAK